MSKGSPIIPVRMKQELLDRIQAARASANARRKGPELGLTEWIKQACEEKLAHLARSNKGKGKKKAGEEQAES